MGSGQETYRRLSRELRRPTSAETIPPLDIPTGEKLSAVEEIAGYGAAIVERLLAETGRSTAPYAVLALASTLLEGAAALVSVRLARAGIRVTRGPHTPGSGGPVN